MVQSTFLTEFNLEILLRFIIHLKAFISLYVKWTIHEETRPDTWHKVLRNTSLIFKSGHDEPTDEQTF